MKLLHPPAPQTRATYPRHTAPTLATATRTRSLRAGALRSMMMPVLATLYTLATWHAPHRVAMLTITAALITYAGVMYRYAEAIARSAVRPVAYGIRLLGSVLGAAALSLLDGGVASPLGAVASTR